VWDLCDNVGAYAEEIRGWLPDITCPFLKNESEQFAMICPRSAYLGIDKRDLWERNGMTRTTVTDSTAEICAERGVADRPLGGRVSKTVKRTVSATLMPANILSIPLSDPLKTSLAKAAAAKKRGPAVKRQIDTGPQGGWGDVPASNDVDREVTALHEAGHAVMRRLRGLPATNLWLFEPGVGFCEGTGKPVDPLSDILVALAGFAVECGYGLVALDFAKAKTCDFDYARELLAGRPWMLLGLAANEELDPSQWLPVELTVDAALAMYFERACRELWPLEDLITRIGERLDWEGQLNARSVAAMCREYYRREGL